MNKIGMKGVNISGRFRPENYTIENYPSLKSELVRAPRFLFHHDFNSTSNINYSVNFYRQI